jgi:endonuclease/exonuclease/phosphatase (EEP) superfamily protein YafD
MGSAIKSTWAWTNVLPRGCAQRSWPAFLLTVFVYGYLSVIGAVFVLIRVAGDRWWFATLLTYGPRWIYGAPLLVLIPAALFWRRFLLLPLAFGALFALFGLMGFCIPWQNVVGGPPSDLRVLSYNIRRYSVPGLKFSELLDLEQPDLIAVQECAGIGRWIDWWPRHGEWFTAQRGELMIASRFPIKDVRYSYCQWPPRRSPPLNAIYCLVSTPWGDVGFCNLHFDTPRRALSAVLDRHSILNLNNIDDAQYRLECRRLESRDLRAWLNGFPEPKIVAGDFNMTTDSTIYQRDWSRFENAFSTVGWGLGATKQTVIRRRRYGLRIDHILAGPASTAVESWVGPDLGSDHLPLFAEFALP